MGVSAAQAGARESVSARESGQAGIKAVKILMLELLAGAVTAVTKKGLLLQSDL